MSKRASKRVDYSKLHITGEKSYKTDITVQSPNNTSSSYQEESLIRSFNQLSILHSESLDTLNSPPNKSTDLSSTQTTTLPSSQYNNIPLPSPTNPLLSQSSDIPSSLSPDPQSFQHIEVLSQSNIALASTSTNLFSSQLTDTPLSQLADVPLSQSTDLPSSQLTDILSSQLTDIPSSQSIDIPSSQSTKVLSSQSTNILLVIYGKQIKTEPIVSNLESRQSIDLSIQSEMSERIKKLIIDERVTANEIFDFLSENDITDSMLNIEEVDEITKRVEGIRTKFRAIHVELKLVMVTGMNH